MPSAVTPAVVAVVLISQLGAPRYRDRTHASNKLYQLTPALLPYLEAAQLHADPEVSKRSQVILASYFSSVADQLAGKARPSHWPRLPWLDMLPPEHPDRRV